MGFGSPKPQPLCIGGILKGFFIKLMVLSQLTISSVAFGAGQVSVVSFSGPDDPDHKDIVQFEIVGGFSGEYNAGSCNASFAAIRNTPERQHMISFLLTAYATKANVKLVLNQNDKYFMDRCTVSRIWNIN
jgi:hypothetical protein